jgi:hypothetical protein
MGCTAAVRRVCIPPAPPPPPPGQTLEGGLPLTPNKTGPSLHRRNTLLFPTADDPGLSVTSHMRMETNPHSPFIAVKTSNPHCSLKSELKISTLPGHRKVELCPSWPLIAVVIIKIN